MFAVDALLMRHGRLVYACPNPFGWRAPFLAADSGAAILGRRIDFYDWRGRLTQQRWGTRAVRVSSAPIVPGGPDTRAPDDGCGAPASGDVGERIGQLARAQLGRGRRIPDF